MRRALAALGLLVGGAWSVVAAETAPVSRPVETVFPAQPQLPAVLDLAAAMRTFRTQGLDLLLADAAVAGAAGDESAARAVANPSVSLGTGRTSTYEPSACPGCSNKLFSAGLSDDGAVFDSLAGKRRLRIEVARAVLAAARRSRADAERTVGLAVKQQYLAACLAKSSLGFTRQNAKAGAETLHLVEARFHAGAVSEADVARAESAKLEADQAVDQAEQTLEQAKVTLAFLLGVRDGMSDFDVSDEFLRVAVPGRLGSAARDDLVKEALAQRPDLQAADDQRARAEASLALARRQRVPDVALSLGYSEEGRGQNAIQPPTTTLGVTVGLPVFDQQQGEIARARADLAAQELQRTKLQAQVISDVKGGWAGFTAARWRAERMESRLLGRTERARDLVRIQYEKGAASLLELLDAQRTLIATRQEYLGNLNDYWTAVFQLEAAVGTDLR